VAEQKRIIDKLEELMSLVDIYDKTEQKLAALNAAFPDLLKKAVLQDAVQGKLVPQDPRDEPASVLLEKIRKEKQSLVKKGKPPKPIADEEIPFDIPASWEWVRLGEIISLIMGQSPDGNSVNLDTGIEFHQGKSYFSDYIINKSEQKTSNPTKIVPPNSILLCVRAPVGKVNITDREICIGRGLCGLVFLADMPFDFLFYILATYEYSFNKQATGTTFKAIQADTIVNQLFPLPPLAEQKRIITKIDDLFTIIEGQL
jgi:type I restriction enzyme S subunit